MTWNTQSSLPQSWQTDSVTATTLSPVTSVTSVWTDDTLTNTSYDTTSSIGSAWGAMNTVTGSWGDLLTNQLVWFGVDQSVKLYPGSGSFNVLGRSFNQLGITFNHSVPLGQHQKVWRNQ